VDLLVTNANVLTLDGRDTPASPTRSAIAIHAGKIVAVGRDQDVAAFRRPAMRVIDAGGRTVLPGFIEPHNHMVGYGTALIGVDARTPPNETIADLVTRLRQAAAASPSHRWILGRGYDDTGLRDMRHPTRRDLDRASTEHPIVIWHNSGHLLVANSKALAMAGITATTADPPGGRIGRLEGSAEPDGVLYEAPAQTMVSRLIPAYEPAELAAAFARAQDEFLRQGVTTIHDAHVSRLRGLDIHDTYRRMHADGALKLRVNMFMQWDYLKELDFAPVPGSGDERLRVAGCKIVSDGSIQGITAALREPYYCNEGEKGWLIYEQAELDDMVLTLHRRGYQIAIHANGDAAIDSVLLAYGRALQTIPRADHRHRIEHCQVCHPGQLEQIRRLGVIPNFFANHVYYWGDRHRDRFLGPERVQVLDPVGSAFRAGIRPMLHSDCPVTPVSPLFCVQSATARVTSSGKVLNDPERVAVREALSTVTSNAARGAFEERVKGTLEVGKLGDLVILGADPLKEAPHEIGKIPVAATVVGGEVVYQEAAIG